MKTHKNNYLLLLNGLTDIDISEFITKHQIKEVICADGGVNQLPSNINKYEVIGDRDSIQNQKLEFVQTFSPDKNKSDGELALEFILEHKKDINKIYVLGAIDKDLIRLDHFYNNLLTLAHPLVEIHTKYNVILFTENKLEIANKENYESISIFNLTNVKGLTIRGARYNVDKVNLTNQHFWGLSNEFTNQNITIELEKGRVCVFLNLKIKK